MGFWLVKLWLTIAESPHNGKHLRQAANNLNLPTRWHWRTFERFTLMYLKL
jgi:hypothetical protein